MKTIVRTGTNISLYLFNNETVVFIGNENTIVGYPPETIISDCTINNSILYENIESPLDWVGGKYFYTLSDGWTLNPNWTPPPPPPPPPPQPTA